VCEAAVWPSRFSATSVARERLRDGADRAGLRVVRAVPGFGGRSTPARRAFDSPIAIACLAERAPCLPSRTCSISSRTNSPACVLHDHGFTHHVQNGMSSRALVFLVVALIAAALAAAASPTRRWVSAQVLFVRSSCGSSPSLIVGYMRRPPP